MLTNNGKTGRIGVIQKYTILSTGTYRIKAGGARGGKHVTNYGKYPGKYFIFIWAENGTVTQISRYIDIQADRNIDRFQNKRTIV